MSTYLNGTRSSIFAVGLVFAGVLQVAFGAAGAAQEARRSVWDGAYTEEQATRGKEQYDYNCATCHIHDLTGDSIKDIPPLGGDDFVGEWSGKTLQELVEYMSTNMPPDSRGSLAAGTYADIAAYVLKANNFPAGKEALGSDKARLATTFIEREPKK